MSHVVLLTEPVVDQQMLAQKTGRYHPGAVVYEAFSQQLTSGGINYRKAGLTQNPGLPSGIVSFPGESTEVVPEGFVE